jgi:hypothetical protein
MRLLIAVLVPSQKVNYPKSVKVASHDLHARFLLLAAMPRNGKAVANKSKYPHIVELVIDGDKLDVEFSRRMMDFHRSRKIQARHGRRIVREGQISFRWCFSDLTTARAFMGQFGGEVPRPERRRRRR